MKNVVLSEKERAVLCDILKSNLASALANHNKEDVKSLCYKVGAGETFENVNK